MSSLVDRPVVIRLAPFAALLLARWYDREIVLPAQRHASATFDNGAYMLASAAGSILVAGLVLALGVLAWRSRSVAVGIGYALLGAVVAFDMYASFTVVGNLPGLPSGAGPSIADLMYDVWYFLYGPLGAASSVGAGMLVAGVAVVFRAGWEHRAGARPDRVAARPAQRPV